jgi:hypothetical protein
MKKQILIPLVAVTLIAGGAGAHYTFAAPNNSHTKPFIKTLFTPGVSGTVSVVASSSLTVTSKNNFVYTVDTSAAKIYKDFASTTVALSTVKSGDQVMVRGTISGTNVKADTVIVGKFRGPHGLMKGLVKKAEKKVHSIVGVVSSIGASSTLSVTAKNNTVYTVDASNATVFKGSASTTPKVSDIRVGDSVIVKGQVGSTTVKATTILDTRISGETHKGIFKR